MKEVSKNNVGLNPPCKFSTTLRRRKFQNERKKKKRTRINTNIILVTLFLVVIICCTSIYIQSWIVIPRDEDLKDKVDLYKTNFRSNTTSGVVGSTVITSDEKNAIYNSNAQTYSNQNPEKGLIQKNNNDQLNDNKNQSEEDGDGKEKSGDENVVHKSPMLASNAFLTMYGNHRYQDAFDALPQWLQEYFTWHNEQTSKIGAATSDIKYAGLICLPNHNSCGGIADRLRPLLFYLFLAKQSNRVLCIHWTKNFALEEYLQPISNFGIDWRCPTEIQDPDNLFQWKSVLFSGGGVSSLRDYIAIVKFKRTSRKYMSLGLRNRSANGINDLNLFAQRYSYGRHQNGTFVMPNLVHADFPDIMGDIFRVMFEPVPKLAHHINSTMAKLNLVENEYISVHVRARYPAPMLKQIHRGNKRIFDKGNHGLDFSNPGLKSHVVDFLTNAIECGDILSPNSKMLIITDNTNATKYAISNDFSFGDSNNNARIVRPIGVDRDEESPHTDGIYDNNTDFTSTFEDLLIMGGSKCVVHGNGGFGSFGAALAGGNKCRAMHRFKLGRSLTCPNDNTNPDPVTINATDMLFGDKPVDSGNVIFDRSRYTRFYNI